VNKKAAIDAYTVAKDALDAATTAGGTVPTLVALQQKAQAAADAEIKAIGVWNAAVYTYDTVLVSIKASSQKAHLLISGAQQQMKADETAVADATAAATAAATTLDAAKTAATDALDSLNLDVSSGIASPSTISSKRTAYENASQAVVNATLANNSAQNALTVAEERLVVSTALFNRGAYGIVDASGNPLIDASGHYILEQAAEQQLAQIDDATANRLANTYISLVAAYNKLKAEAVAADNSSAAAANALQAAIAGGLTLENITALSMLASEAAAKASTANNAANAAQNAAINALGSIYASTSAASALTILTATLASQNANTALAYVNQMAAQLNTAYAKNVNAQNAVVSSMYAQYLTNTATDNALKGGASISEIQRLQAVSQEASNILAKDTHVANQTQAALTQHQTWATLDPNSAAILQAAQVQANAAAKAAAINTLVLNYMRLMAAKDSATATKDAAQSEYNTVNAALNTAITQGQSIQQIQAARAVVQDASNKLAQTDFALKLATDAKDAALNNLKGKDASGNTLLDSSGNPLVDASGNSLNAAAENILRDALIVQQRAINDAEANVLVKAYTNAYSVFQTTLTALEAAQSAVLIATRNLDIAITSGNSVDQIQQLRTILENATIVQTTAQTSHTNATNAKDAALLLIMSGTTLDASGNPVSNSSDSILKTTAAINLLTQTQLAQKAAILNSQSNALARAYITALEAKVLANVNLTNAQTAYDAAAAAMNQAITGGATIPEIQALQLAAQTAGEAVATAQSAANAAATAATLALDQVTVNPNAVKILQELQQYQAKKASMANANKLLDLFYAATAAAKTATNNLALSTNAARIAGEALDAAINAGADVAQIQSLQVTANAANISKSNAQAAFDLANSKMNQAQSNANSDPIANGILIFARQTAIIAEAKAALNSANNALSASMAAKTAAAAAAAVAEAANTAATALLNSAVAPYDASGNPNGGKTQQEIVLLQQAATQAANNASVTMNASNAAQADVIAKGNTVAYATNAVSALPAPNPRTVFAYTMTCVRLNETQAGTDSSGNHVIYIDSDVLATASVGKTVGSVTYPAVNLNGVQILGTGISSSIGSPTNILTYSVVPSLPNALYPSCVAVIVNNPVTAGDGVFYLVGGEFLLYDFIV
jgi:hypothetical protein